MEPAAPAPTTTTTTTPAPTPAPMPMPAPAPAPVKGEHTQVLRPGMACETGTYYAHPRCTKFFICVNGGLLAQSCAPGLHWSSERSRCDFPAQAGCSERRAPAKERPAGAADASAAIMDQAMSMMVGWANRALWLRAQTLRMVELLSDYLRSLLLLTPADLLPLFLKPDNGSYSPHEVDASLCSHVVYAWAALRADTLTIAPRDPALDIDMDFYGQMSALRLKGVKVLIGVGGWEESAGDKWSRLAAAPARREAFVSSALQFLQRWQFDGIEINWQYPVCWQSSCEEADSHAADRDGFSALMLELSAALRPRGLLLAAGVAGTRRVAARAYHARDLAAAADWLTVAAYDYHGAWERRAGHAAPLTSTGDDESINSSLTYWIDSGVPAEQLVLAMPFYGQSYTLDKAAAGAGAAPGALATGPGLAGPLTAVPGFLAYHEICSGVRSGDWSATHTAQGSYAQSGAQWVSYMAAADAARAVSGARERGVLGAAAWALDLDDWPGACGCGRHPLLHAVRRALLDPEAPPTDCLAR